MWRTIRFFRPKQKRKNCKLGAARALAHSPRGTRQKRAFSIISINVAERIAPSPSDSVVSRFDADANKSAAMHFLALIRTHHFPNSSLIHFECVHGVRSATVFVVRVARRERINRSVKSEATGSGCRALKHYLHSAECKTFRIKWMHMNFCVVGKSNKKRLQIISVNRFIGVWLGECARELCPARQCRCCPLPLSQAMWSKWKKQWPIWCALCKRSSSWQRNKLHGGDAENI